MARILVVDDDTAIGTTVETILSRAGHSVVYEENSRKAAAMIKADGADLLISDLFMPEADGLQLVLDLQDAASRPPVILMTGGGRLFPRGDSGLDALTDSARMFGVQEIVYKPFRRADLIAAVNRCLGIAPEAPDPR